jgi:hypothetical protein
MDIFFSVFFILVYCIPSIIAFKRNHHYKWVIFSINIFGIIGFPWLVAMIWAVWPAESKRQST